MFWADRVAEEIIKSGNYKPYWVDDMKTPSGRIHVGSLRGVVVHDLVNRALQDRGVKTRFTYVFEDHDPMDGLPHYLDAKIWSQYLGKPLYSIPSPVTGFDSYAKHYAFEFQKVFEKIGSHPEIIWTSSLYFDGRMNEDIKICLDNVNKIKKIYQEIYHKELGNNWYPFQAVCHKCGKESTTKVTNWDGEKVTYSCNINQVDWTKGCGNSGKISPFSGKDYYAGKLPWKVEWAVKWKVIGVTVEGAGKDHMSAGGSHDVASRVCREVISYPVPFPVPYEFFLIRGKKMSSSKGLGSSAKEVSEIIPPYLLRFLMVRTQIQQAIDFDPYGMTIPDLFDEYDSCWQEYNHNGDKNLARAFVLSQIGEYPAPNKDLFISRFRDITNLTQLPNIKLQNKLEQIKGSKLNDFEKKILGERLTCAIYWLANYAPDDYRYQISIKLYPEIDLSAFQWNFLNDLSTIWQNAEDPEKLQSEIFQLAKEKNIDLKDAFKALYTVVLDKSHGPRAGWLLKKFTKELVMNRLTLNKSQTSRSKESKIKIISKPEFFSIDPGVAEKYPSVSIGAALIKGVKIEKINPELEKEKDQLLQSLKGITTETLGQYPEIISYRKLYKEMGVDWHSRRPSPEALLRRIILGKGLYNINTCVDAYNLIVMKHRISVGAFDYDKVNFPTILRFAGEGDEILLLGDDKPTKYSAKELAYYDKMGGYNIDFNYRDAKRTMVTEETKNIWINVDGILDIMPAEVEQTLRESIEIIIKYCGGKVEFEGVVK
ncbi:lysine--tRNA ligase [Candidatus Gottesmanbacteria bacterium RIFCSPHIGHO2_02_FULL_40_13]|uniref:Lysine--tRNA ligase n=1 Tax=Candidatus Gottesmanbacteria bacterium RIFCSPHIGHO2_02_FULL_40_13 TaxID=1798384 RepID=A0A1F6A5V2_9BACT|nr:MAG: lysine--tRNA ligase [Candidatus Gottesmanbacteria bacterium RIFCSPHIGHO2_02_FULL_40_13]